MENWRAGPASSLRHGAAPSRAPTVSRSIRRVAAGPRAASAPHAWRISWMRASRCCTPGLARAAVNQPGRGRRVGAGRRPCRCGPCDRRDVSRVVRGCWPTGRPGTSAPTSGREPAATRGTPCEHRRRSAGVAIQRPPGGRAGASRATARWLSPPRVAAALRPLPRPPPGRPTFPSIPAARPWRGRPPPARARPALRRGTARRRAAAPRPPRRGCARRRRSGRTPARRPDTSSRRR